MSNKNKAFEISFVVLCLIFLITLFIAFFFSSSYFSNAALIVELILAFISVPFVFGGISSERYRTPAMCSIVFTLPFLANWISVFTAGEAFFSHGGLGEVLFYACTGSIIITDVLLILYVSGVIKTADIVQFVPIALAVLTSIFAIVVFAITQVVKPYAVPVIVLQVFMPNYTGFYVLMKDRIKNK